MAYLLAIPVALFLAALIYGGLAGRLRMRSDGCCAPADPAKDLRMREVDERGGET